MMGMETIDINLANAILAEIKFSELPEFLEMLNLDDLII